MKCGPVSYHNCIKKRAWKSTSKLKPWAKFSPTKSLLKPNGFSHWRVQVFNTCTPHNYFFWGQILQFSRFWALLLLLFLWVGTASASDKTPIYIEVIGEADFDVLYHRANSNSTGGLIGGLIGASIQLGIEADRDRGKVAILSPLLADKETWQIHFLEKLNERLNAKGYEAILAESSKDVEDGLLLKIYPDNYGFKMVDTSTALVSAFVEFEAILLQTSSKAKKNKKKQRVYVTAKKRRPWQDFLDDQDTVNSDLEAALEKAAKRIANKIIYSKEV